jgi:hypothetical protein
MGTQHSTKKQWLFVFAFTEFGVFV